MANQVHEMTYLCKNLIDLMGTFYESLYDQLFDEGVCYYSDGPDLPPSRITWCILAITIYPKTPSTGTTRR
eukprot:3521619-Prorocentrum_lima.AAC.1